MDVLYVFGILLIIVLVLILVFGASSNAESERSKIEKYYSVDRKLDHVLDSTSVKEIKDTMSELEQAYNEAAQYLGDSSKGAYQSDMEDLQDTVEMLEEEAWEKQADRYLEAFADLYYEIMSGDLDDISDRELLMDTKKKCIEELKNYYSIDLSAYETAINPKRYIREWFEEDYDPCMTSCRALEIKLNEHIREIS